MEQSMELRADQLPAAPPSHRRATDLKCTLICLVDPRALTRDCLSHCLQALGFPNLIALAEAEGEIISPTPPDLLLVNTGGNLLSDPAVRRTIHTARQRFPASPLIILADDDNPDDVREMIGLGVRGYIHTSLDLSVAAAALRLVLAGGTFIPVMRRGASGLASREPVRDSDHRADAQLTPREIEVLRHLEQGKTNREIAHELKMRESTVKSHVRQMKHKTQLRSRVELALKATRYLMSRDRGGPAS
jgi:DNA-binding NarL/FixJ family response regulator